MKSGADTFIELRPSLTDYLSSRIKALKDGYRHNLALIGNPGSGKSQLILNAIRNAQCTVVPVCFSMQRESSKDFLRRFIVSVVRSSVDASGDEPLDDLIKKASLVIPKTVLAIQELKEVSAGRLQVDAFVRTLDLVSVVQKELNRPCVFVLDEFLHLENMGLSHAFHELGKRVMTWPDVMFLLTSSSSYRARQILRERLHLLFGQFEIISLGDTQLKPALSWMRNELSGIRAPDEILKFLHHWAGESPWSLGVILKRLRECSSLKKKSRINNELLIQALWDVLGDSGGVLYQWYSRQIEFLLHQRFGMLAVEALIHISCGLRTTQALSKDCSTSRNISQSMQLLVENDLIQRKGACWVIPDKVFSSWLSCVCAKERIKQTSLKSDLRQSFEESFNKIYSQWVASVSEPMTSRVSKLLSHFKNETVSLDHKTGRLPQFKQMHARASSRIGETYIVADSEERRWCCFIHEGKVEESGIAAFEDFCKEQAPRPSRKVVIAKDGLELNATLLAKEANMWVWEPHDLNLLLLLYGQPPLH